MNQDMFKMMNINSGNGCVIEAPDSFPDDLDFSDTANDSCDFVQVFVREPALFAEEIAEAERICRKGGDIWVLTPEKAECDFSEEFMSAQGAPLGMKPSQQVKLGDGWIATKMDVMLHH